MSSRSRAALLAVVSGTFPATAHAQHVPLWLFAAVLSPIAVLLLCVVLGAVTRSWRTGLRHAGLVVLWVTLFSLASYFVENDYVIWTPLALYVLHAALVGVLIAVAVVRRVGGRAPESGDRSSGSNSR